MPRPKSKKELIITCQQQYEKLIHFINSLPTEEQLADFPEGTMNRNIRDVLGHLYHWHMMMSTWYEIGMQGEKPDIPAKGYNWRTIPALNKHINALYQHMDLELVKTKFINSHAEMGEIINAHTNEELFERKRYKWTGNNAMAAYLIGATSSHYDWALKLIKKQKKRTINKVDG